MVVAPRDLPHPAGYFRLITGSLQHGTLRADIPIPRGLFAKRVALIAAKEDVQRTNSNRY